MTRVGSGDSAPEPRFSASMGKRGEKGMRGSRSGDRQQQHSQGAVVTVTSKDTASGGLTKPLPGHKMPLNTTISPPPPSCKFIYRVNPEMSPCLQGSPCSKHGVQVLPAPRSSFVLPQHPVTYWVNWTSCSHRPTEGDKMAQFKSLWRRKVQPGTLSWAGKGCGMARSDQSSCQGSWTRHRDRARAKPGGPSSKGSHGMLLP